MVPTATLPPADGEPPRTFGERVFANRLWVGLSVVLLAAFFVRPQLAFPGAPIVAAGLILLGLAVRAWAGGCAGEHTRDAVIGAPRLVTGGPFAYVRNPIYLASIVLGFGMVILLGDARLFVCYAAVLAFLYAVIVPAEERFLQQKFGALYESYCAHVPRFLPRTTGWRGGEPATFQPRAVLGEARLGLVLAGIYGLLQFGAWLRA